MSNSYADLTNQLNQISAKMRKLRIEAFRQVIVVVRSKVEKSQSDIMLSKAYDAMQDILKHPVCDMEDIDDLLDTVQCLVDLESICQQL